MKRSEVERRIALAVSLFALAAGACGNLTPGGFGDVTVSVSGDSPAALTAAPVVAAQVAALGPSPLLGPALSDEDEPEGRLEVEFLLFLLDGDGGRWPLSEDELEVQVDLRGRTEADVIDRIRLPANVYTDLEIRFLEIKAEVEGGLVIGGVPILGEVRVELEDSTLTVSKPVNLNLTEGGMAELLVDLNASTWLQALDVDLRSVAEQIFQDAITVGLREP